MYLGRSLSGGSLGLLCCLSDSFGAGCCIVDLEVPRLLISGQGGWIVVWYSMIPSGTSLDFLLMVEGIRLISSDLVGKKRMLRGCKEISREEQVLKDLTLPLECSTFWYFWHGLHSPVLDSNFHGTEGCLPPCTLESVFPKLPL